MNSRLVVMTALALVALPLATRAGTPERTSTVADQRSIDLTVYNDGNALVHDHRRLHLNAGSNRIAWRDVSATMDPATAILGAIDPRVAVSVLEQNFDYNVLGQDSLLHAFVGKYVTVVHPPKFGGDRPHRERAKLLAADGGIVLQYHDRVETQLDGYIEFPDVPPSLRDRPTLTLDVEAARTAPAELELRYLASGLTWNVDYVATLSRDQSSMSLMGLVTLSNESGTDYHNAQLQLVAGSLHQVPVPSGVHTIARVVSRAVAATYGVYAVGASEERAFQYHLYSINRPTTILDKQKKQIGLLSAHDIPVATTYKLQGGNYYQYSFSRPDAPVRIPVSVFVSFDNKSGELGIPLPAGTVRVYQDDQRGLSQYIGGDSIEHTPSNETVHLQLGDAFDVVADQWQTDYKRIANCESTSSYKVNVRSAKDQAVDVTVVEPIPGDWKITAESAPHEKTAAFAATWKVPVPANGEASLTYTANVRWCVQ